MEPLKGRRVLITGGTGSLGEMLVHRLLRDNDNIGAPSKIIVFSRDEAKQHQMRLKYMNCRTDTETVIYRNFEQRLQFRIGDVRDIRSVCSALQDADVVINAAALKQVPVCEYFPFEATCTNIIGAENIVHAIEVHKLPIETVVGVSTDKACKPVNAMGMTKALQERIFIQANMRCPRTRFVSVRYGNVIASRGSVVPLFQEQIRNGGPVTITTSQMTRFLLSLDQAVDTVFAAIRDARRGEIYVPKARSARVTDIATALIGKERVEIKIVGIRPGEKVHEILVSQEESHRTHDRGLWFAIQSLLPEIREIHSKGCLDDEYSSADALLSPKAVEKILNEQGLLTMRLRDKASKNRVLKVTGKR
jgi:UDP-glucose 4-epimerase